MSVKAGTAHIELTTRDNVTAGLKSAQKQLEAFANKAKKIGLSLSALGATVTAPILAGVTNFVKVGDALDKMSARTGISVESLSELKYAAEKSGSGLNDLETSLKGLSKIILEAQNGSDAAVNSLGAIGIVFNDLINKSPDEKLQLVLDKLNTLPDETTKAAVAMKLFGESGVNLLPMANNLKELRAEAVTTGAVVSTSQAAAAAAISDAFLGATTAVSELTGTLTKTLAPTIIYISGLIEDLVERINRWAKENPTLVTTITLLAGAITAVGVGLTALGFILPVITTGLSAMSFVLPVLAAAAQGVGAALALALSPVAIIIGTIAAGIAVILKFTGAWDDLVDSINKFSEAKKIDQRLDKELAKLKEERAVKEALREEAATKKKLDNIRKEAQAEEELAQRKLEAGRRLDAEDARRAAAIQKELEDRKKLFEQQEKNINISKANIEGENIIEQAAFSEAKRQNDLKARLDAEIKAKEAYFDAYQTSLNSNKDEEFARNQAKDAAGKAYAKAYQQANNLNLGNADIFDLQQVGAKLFENGAPSKLDVSKSKEELARDSLEKLNKERKDKIDAQNAAGEAYASAYFNTSQEEYNQEKFDKLKSEGIEKFNSKVEDSISAFSTASDAIAKTAEDNLDSNSKLQENIKSVTSSAKRDILSDFNTSAFDRSGLGRSVNQIDRGVVANEQTAKNTAKLVKILEGQKGPTFGI